VAGFLEWVEPWYRHRRRVRRRSRVSPDLAAIHATDGQMSAAEAALLYDLGRSATGGCIVEIGSFHGKSTVALALGARAGGKARVYAVDPYVSFVGACGGRFAPEDKTALLRNLLLAGVADQVWLLHVPSAHAAEGWTEPIALLWIDGDHTHVAVKTDVGAWEPFLVAGGLMAFHDSLDAELGPRRIIDELVASGTFTRVTVVDSLTVIRKGPPAMDRRLP
jgi:hypothetical protein